MQIRINDKALDFSKAELCSLCDFLSFAERPTYRGADYVWVSPGSQDMQIQEGSLSIENVKPRGLRVDLRLNLTA